MCRIKLYEYRSKRACFQRSEVFVDRIKILHLSRVRNINLTRDLNGIRKIYSIPNMVKIDAMNNPIILIHLYQVVVYFLFCVPLLGSGVS